MTSPNSNAVVEEEMSKKEIISLLILIAVISFATYMYLTREYSITKSKYLLDTIIEINGTSRFKNIGQKIDSVFVFIQKMEATFNEYDSLSVIWKINNDDQSEFSISSDFYDLLAISDSLYRFTDGVFDITIKPVLDLWGFNSKEPSVPDSLEIKDKLKLVGFDKLTYTHDRLNKPPGMQITFGAIAKGYILDQARKYMKEIGIEKGFINCRSSMTFFGEKHPRIVHIQHPRDPNSTIASFSIMDMAVGTSGDYNQYFEKDEIRYHHILNAKTGYPVQDIFSVTVIHPQTVWADGLSTAFFLLDPDRSIELVRSIPNCETVIYHGQGGTIVSLKSTGMAKYKFHE